MCRLPRQKPVQRTQCFSQRNDWTFEFLIEKWLKDKHLKPEPCIKQRTVSEVLKQVYQENAPMAFFARLHGFLEVRENNIFTVVFHRWYNIELARIFSFLVRYVSVNISLMYMHSELDKVWFYAEYYVHNKSRIMQERVH